LRDSSERHESSRARSEDIAPTLSSKARIGCVETVLLRNGLAQAVGSKTSVWPATERERPRLGDLPDSDADRHGEVTWSGGGKEGFVQDGLEEEAAFDLCCG
jgi:hypothetical protein